MTPLVRAVLAAAVAASSPEAEPADEAVTLVRSGYGQREESLATVQATYEFRGVDLRTGEASQPSEVVEWVSDRDRWRYRRNPELMGSDAPSGWRPAVDIVVDDGVSTSVMRFVDAGGGTQSQATISHALPGPSALGDFRSRCLQLVCDKPLITVGDALADEKNIISCRLQEDGRYLVEYDVDADCVSRIWLSPSKNFLVERIDTIYEKNPRFAGISEEVIETSEVRPGLWMPMIVDMKQMRRSPAGEIVEPQTASRFQITKLVVNEPLPSDAFKVDLPPGTEVSNQITGKLYFWGENGPAGEEIPLPELQTPATFGAEPTARTSNGLGWLVAANVAVLCGVAAYLLLLRRRRGEAL